jgi:hypothetical protein
MRDQSPFQRDDLNELNDLYSRASVMPMVHLLDPRLSSGFFNRVLGLRHDVDNFLEPAVQMAEWESDRGYLSTYFILHTAPYWDDKDQLQRGLERIAECGHEIGFHVNAITAAIETGGDPLEILERDVCELRGYGYDVRGVVAHGDNACYRYGFVNDELFTESARPDYGAPDRIVGGVKLNPVSRTTFGFDYDPNWLPRAEYLSDSGGRWSRPFAPVAAGFPYDGQLHLLVHPDWWAEAFDRERIAA